MKYLAGYIAWLLLIVTAASCSQSDPAAKLIGVWERDDGRTNAPMNAFTVETSGVVFSRHKDGKWGQFFYTFREEEGKSILTLMGPQEEFRIAVDFTPDGRLRLMPQAADVKGEPITYRRARKQQALVDELTTQIANSPALPPTEGD